MTSEEEQERPDGSENNHPQVRKTLNFRFYIVFPALIMWHSSSETICWISILKSIDYNVVFSFYKILQVTKLKILLEFIVTYS